MYPYKFEPIYIEKIWGNNKLSQHRNIDVNNLGIAWEVSAHPTAANIIINGPHKGMSLSEVINNDEEGVLGKGITIDQMLRAAYLDAAEDLSIQVHPYMQYAKAHENDCGKNELWYIIDADEGASLIAGVNTEDINELKEHIESGTFEQCVKRIKVSKGDIVPIKAGMVHALGAGILAIEIGQNSNITYRLYDYNRGRALDVDKSFDVLDPSLECGITKPLAVECDGYTKAYAFVSDEYIIEIIDLEDTYEDCADGSHFNIYTCVEGECEVFSGQGKVEVSTYESFFIPAGMGDYKIEGKCRLLKSYVADVKEIENEIISNITYLNR